MSHPLGPLIEQFKQLPSIGQKSAERLAFYILSQPQQKVAQFSNCIIESRKNIKYCQRCFNLSTTDFCNICTSANRQTEQLCVVADTKSIYALERINRFKGLYHVLGGLLSPIEGLHPDSLRIKELIERCKNETFKEIILAINPSVEGEASILYLKSVLASFSIPITTLAYGLPVGADLDYIDELTLEKAYIGRKTNTE